jgi:hypothetical protein
VALLLDLVDERQILVPFAILDLIDADGEDRAQAAMRQPPFHHVLYRLAHLVPRTAEEHSGFLPRKLPRPVRQE